MSPSSFGHRPAGPADLRAISELGNLWYGSARFNRGVEGRFEYIKMLYYRNRRTFYVMTFNDPFRYENEELIAYSALVSELPHVAKDHFYGHVDQYLYRPEDLYRTDDVIDGPLNTYYYQSIGVHRRFRTAPQAIKERDEMILNHLCAVMTNYETPDFRLIAEPHKLGGRAMMTTYGFKQLPYRTPLDYDLYCFSTTDERSTKVEKFLAELNRRRAKAAAERDSSEAKSVSFGRAPLAKL